MSVYVCVREIETERCKKTSLIWPMKMDGRAPAGGGLDLVGQRWFFRYGTIIGTFYYELETTVFFRYGRDNPRGKQKCAWGSDFRLSPSRSHSCDGNCLFSSGVPQTCIKTCCCHIVVIT